MSDRIRGSIDVPLNKEGIIEAKAMAECFKRRGCPTGIYTSTLTRAIQTGDYIAKACPSAKILGAKKSLCPWFVGMYEGQPTKDVIGKMNDLIKNRPYVTPPGMNEKSTHSGESFNHFREDRLSCFWELKDVIKKDEVIVVVTHYRNIVLLKAVIAKHNGKIVKDAFSLDNTIMTSKNEDVNTSSVHNLRFKGDIWELEDSNILERKPFEKGSYYIVRHGKTDFNG